MFHENGRHQRYEIKLCAASHRRRNRSKENKRKNGDGDYEILMVSLDLHKTGFGRRHHRRRRARNLMLAIFMFTLRSYSPIWMGYSHVCILLAMLDSSIFRFLLCERWPSVLIPRLIPPKSQQWTSAEAPHNSFSCGSHTQQCLSWTQKRHLDYIIILQVRWYSYIYLRNGLLYRHHHHAVTVRRQRWWWWWLRRRRKWRFVVMLFLQCIIIIT